MGVSSVKTGLACGQKALLFTTFCRAQPSAYFLLGGGE